MYKNNFRIDFANGEIQADYLKKKKYNYPSSVCVICQGGGAKGAWQGGVLHGLNSKGVNFISYFGSSVGAINAGLCITDQWETIKDIWYDAPPYFSI